MSSNNIKCNITLKAKNSVVCVLHSGNLFKCSAPKHGYACYMKSVVDCSHSFIFLIQVEGMDVLPGAWINFHHLLNLYETKRDIPKFA
jgi:hypothetical protein